MSSAVVDTRPESWKESVDVILCPNSACGTWDSMEWIRDFRNGPHLRGGPSKEVWERHYSCEECDTVVILKGEPSE